MFNDEADFDFEVFDSINTPKSEVQDGQIIFPKINDNAISRICKRIFTIGLGKPAQAL
ncbi:MAG TPA: hypothetical protein PKA54_05000 [Chitinophagaceae bacterium]|nr:MAG: hypothetical protein UZ11_BCD004001288 [Bacteroidetes bacterium OLB11]HMN32710.1 hypothetical protein [Chitinophagaceae bacterium]